MILGKEKARHYKLRYESLRQFIASLPGNTIYKKILRIYLLVVLAGSLLLWMPFSRKSGGGADLFTSLFTAISAFTNTGLTLKPTTETFNFFGQLVILCLIQLGGMGLLTIAILIWTWLKGSDRPMTVEQRLFIHCEKGSHTQVESLDAVKAGFKYLICIEIISAALLVSYFYTAVPHKDTNDTNGVVDYKGKLFNSIWAAIFHSISAANNSGFDILGKFSIKPYRNDANNILSVILLTESIIGGIGYPIFYDLKIYFKRRKHDRHCSLGLFTKICLVSYFAMALLGIILVLSFELSIFWDHGSFLSLNRTNLENDWGRNRTLNKIWNLIYLTFSARSAGFLPFEISSLSEPTKWLLSSFMFVGTSPASTGGGIRTITLFLILVKLFSTIIGRRNLSLYRKHIHRNALFDSYTIFISAIILVITGTLVISMSILSDKSLKVGDVVFEVTSAFGNVGLTSGVTDRSNTFGRVILLCLMFIGQLGVSNFLVSFCNGQSISKNRRYATARVRLI